MPLDDADAIRKREDEKWNKYWEGISERTRALCLGTLVLIWSIFSQKKSDVVIEFSFRQKIVLLGIALMAVLVIGCDLIEYLAAYQYHKRASGKKVILNSLPYGGWERTMRFVKIAIGLLALLGICIIVGSALVGHAHASTLQDGSEFMGTWCGGDRDAGQYLCVMVGKPTGNLEMSLSWQGYEGWLSCHDVTLRGSALIGVCGRAALVNTQSSSDAIANHMTIYDSSSAEYKEWDRVLQKVDN